MSSLKRHQNIECVQDELITMARMHSRLWRVWFCAKNLKTLRRLLSISSQCHSDFIAQIVHKILSENIVTKLMPHNRFTKYCLKTFSGLRFRFYDHLDFAWNISSATQLNFISQALATIPSLILACFVLFVCLFICFSVCLFVCLFCFVFVCYNPVSYSCMFCLVLFCLVCLFVCFVC